jgi:hypothetical protein
VEGIDGVLYAHDDALLNITELTMGQTIFPGNSIIGNDIEHLPLSYEDMRTVKDVEAHSHVSYRIHQNGTLSKADGQHFTDWRALSQTLVSVPFHRVCIPRLHNLAADKASSKYKDEENTFLVPAPTQGDFLFVPTALADDFSEAAGLMMKHQVFLECGFAAIVQMLRITANATVRTIRLCSGKNSQGSRGNARMIYLCNQKGGRAFGTYHPYKVSIGAEKWSSVFDSLTYA